jgi:YegS/Rv2252/BmrU family lipid kinase
LITVILNPTSGAGGKPELARDLTELFRAAGLESRIVRVAATDDVGRAVTAAIDPTAEMVVGAGGDGTISAVGAALAGGPMRLGVLPLGTLNHFARDLGIPLDLKAAVDTIANGTVARVDVGRVNDRVFLNNSSLGVYPDIVERREALRQQGRAKWPAFMLATLEILRRNQDVTVRLETGRGTIVSRTPFVFVGNNEYVVEGIHLGSRARLDSGQLFAYIAPPVRTRDLPRLLVHALASRDGPQHELRMTSGREFWIDLPRARRIRVACDGEVLTMSPTLHFRAWPGALHVMTPAA